MSRTKGASNSKTHNSDAAASFITTRCSSAIALLFPRHIVSPWRRRHALGSASRPKCNHRRPAGFGSSSVVTLSAPNRESCWIGPLPALYSWRPNDCLIRRFQQAKRGPSLGRSKRDFTGGSSPKRCLALPDARAEFRLDHSRAVFNRASLAKELA